MRDVFYVLNENKVPCRVNGKIRKFTSKEEAAEWAQTQKEFLHYGCYYVADWLETVLFKV